MNFTSEQHERNAQGDIVIEPAGKTIARMREKQQSRNFVYGVIISALALGVVLTGTMLGAATRSNSDLQARINTLQNDQNQSAYNQQFDTNDTNSANTDMGTDNYGTKFDQSSFGQSTYDYDDSTTTNDQNTNWRSNRRSRWRDRWNNYYDNNNYNENFPTLPSTQSSTYESTVTNV
jgi:type II secretory pathway pseudopilin PulG